MVKFATRRLFQVMCASGLMILTSNAMASAYQLWEQDAASVGNYHAGRAAEANDASTAFYNSAGIPRIKNQQLILGDDLLLTNLKFKGTVKTSSTKAVANQGGGFNQVPNFNYVAPITDRLGFGLSLVAPFGLQTNYGRQDSIQYISSRSYIATADLSPSLGYSFNDHLSLGAGVDIERIGVLLKQSVIVPTEELGIHGSNVAYGFHLGAMYQFSPETRVGLAYHSKIVHHIHATSYLQGTLDGTAVFPVQSTIARTTFAMPAVTTLSGYHKVDDKLAVMGTLSYTQWDVVKDLVIKNAAGNNGYQTLDIPQHYRNTWNVSLGANYNVTDRFMLRTGVGYDQSPVNDTYRVAQLPDNDRYAVALGAHFQATKSVGFDVGWSHLFVTKSTPINYTSPTGVNITGKSYPSADVLAAQVVWNIT